MYRKLLLAVTAFTLLLVMVAGAVFAEENTTISFILKYDSGNLSLHELKLLDGAPPTYLDQPETGYEARIIDFKNFTLFSMKFSIDFLPKVEPPKEWFDKNGTQIFFPKRELRIEEQATIVLNVPYFRTINFLEIWSPDNILLLKEDISEYAACNLNNFCEEKETTINCPEDCKLEEKESKTALSSIAPVIVGVVSLIILITIAFYVIKRRRN